MICIPINPTTKQPKRIQPAFSADNPAFSRYLFDEGNMLNKAEKIYHER